MHKFAFLVHLRSYRDDLGEMAAPLGKIPEKVYRSLLRNRPVDPFIWSEVKLTPGFDEPEGYIIMIPYSGRQFLEQKRQMLPLLKKALNLAKSKGARVVGLGALTSPVTLGGRLLANTPDLVITNGNAYTAVILFNKIIDLLQTSIVSSPSIAIVGATGSVGSLVCMLIAQQNPSAKLLLVARNERKLSALVKDMVKLNGEVKPVASHCIQDVNQADIVLLVTSSTDNVLPVSHLNQGAVVVDATQPRNISQSALKNRPDITLIDGGLVSVDYLKTNKIGRLGLPEGISFACLAETMLLAKAGWDEDFSIGNPTLQQAETISRLAHEFSYLGFGIAPDHRFGKPMVQGITGARQSREHSLY